MLDDRVLQVVIVERDNIEVPVQRRADGDGWGVAQQLLNKQIDVAAARQEIRVLDAAAVGVSGDGAGSIAGARRVGYVPPRPRVKRSAAIAQPQGGAQRLQALIRGAATTASRSGNTVTGDAAHQAAEIVRFLESIGEA
jgi:hypothetical protein